MELINSLELVTAGVAFSIIEEPNEETGIEFIPPSSEPCTACESLRELTGAEDDLCPRCQGITGELRGFVDVAADGSVDDYALLDDHERWSHEADVFLAEAERQRRLEETKVGGDLTWARRANATVVRERRTLELMHYIWRMRRNRTQRQRVARGVSARYADSVRLVVERGRGEWELLYVTKAQRQALVAACYRPELARDYITPAGEEAIEVIPPGGWAHILAWALLTA